MEFYFPDQHSDIRRLPPEQVRILDLQAEPYPDGQRVHVNLEITPFEKRPHLEVSLNDAQGNEVGSVGIVEPMSWRLEFTMHIRGDPNAGLYTLLVRLYYPEMDLEGLEVDTSVNDQQDTDQCRLTFEIPPTM